MKKQLQHYLQRHYGNCSNIYHKPTPYSYCHILHPRVQADINCTQFLYKNKRNWINALANITKSHADYLISLSISSDNIFLCVWHVDGAGYALWGITGLFWNADLGGPCTLRLSTFIHKSFLKIPLSLLDAVRGIPLASGPGQLIGQTSRDWSCLPVLA